MTKFQRLLPHSLLLFVVLFLLVPYLFTHPFRDEVEFCLFRHKLIQNGNPAFFFVANMYNNEIVLPNWIDQFLKLASIIGHDKVFLSIFENDSKDATSEILEDFRKLLDQHNIRNKIVTSKNRYKRGSTERIQHLSRMRHLALHPFYLLLGVSDPQSLLPSYGSSVSDPELEMDMQTQSMIDFREDFVGNKHSRLMFLNDIYFKALDIVRLISTANGDHDIACGLDFYTLFYDHYATRDLNGDWFSDYFPFVRHEPSQKLARRGQDFIVYSCWNGGVSMNPAPFIESHLTFRANEPGADCIHSECFLICEDYRRLGYPNIYINPKVKVTYQQSDYLFHQYLSPIADFFLSIFYFPSPKYVAPNYGSQFNLSIECGTPKS